MCAGSIEISELVGSAKGAQGWFPLGQGQVVYDHPFNAQMDEALIIDFTNPSRGVSKRVSVELSRDSATILVQMIEAALLQGSKKEKAHSNN